VDSAASGRADSEGADSEGADSEGADSEGADSSENNDSGNGAGEHEPDYRFTLANERTFLAWIRSSLSLLAAGIAVVQLVPAFPLPGVRTITGGLLVVLAVLCAANGVLRWQRVEYAMRRDGALPRQRAPWVLAVGLVVLALLGLALVIVKGVDG
jgi:putative membrane protein